MKKGISIRGQASRDRLERSALHCFVTHGIDATTTKGIARGARMAEGNLYRHYAGKEELAWALYEKHLGGFVSALTEQGNGQREHLLRAAFRAIDQHPWTGIGLGQFRPSKFAGVDAPKEIIDHPGKAHNQLVSIAAEVGVGGAIVFLVMLGSLLRRAWKTSYGSMTMGAVCIFEVLSTTHDPLFHAPFSMALVLAIGLGLRDQRVGDSGPTSTPT